MTAPQGDEPPQQALTENTPTRLRDAIIVGAAFVGGALWISTRLSGLEQSTDRMNYRLDSIEHLARDAASRSDLRAFAEDLQDGNPTVRVPKVR